MSRKVLAFPDLYEASITELQDGLQGNLFTSVDLVNVRNEIILFYEIDTNSSTTI